MELKLNPDRAYMLMCQKEEGKGNKKKRNISQKVIQEVLHISMNGGQQH